MKKLLNFTFIIAICLFATSVFAAPIILIIMSAVDILGVVTSGDEKGMRKAWSNLIKRFIICIVIFLLPLLVNFVIGWTAFNDLTACL